MVSFILLIISCLTDWWLNLKVYIDAEGQHNGDRTRRWVCEEPLCRDFAASVWKPPQNPGGLSSSCFFPPASSGFDHNGRNQCSRRYLYRSAHLHSTAVGSYCLPAGLRRYDKWTSEDFCDCRKMKSTKKNVTERELSRVIAVQSNS